MPYITLKQSPIYHQITLDEILSGEVNIKNYITPNYTNTRTVFVERVNEKFLEKFNINAMINALMAFNIKYKDLIEADKDGLYNTFYIPKHSGGLRRIDAPNAELMEALKCLKEIFEKHMFALYHTSAFAYVKGRCTVDSVKRHQQNESKWFAKIDFSNFFGSTTLEFVLKMFAMIFPFSEIVKTEAGKNNLGTALSLCFLNGGLPQGTPISPLITNVMMIPIDHKISNGLRKREDNNYVYTRYADDILISSRHDFSCEEIQKFVLDILKEFSAPFSIKEEKTRYGSSAGRNWNLGVMLNKDNQITIGHKKKKQFKAMINNYICDTLKNINWEIHDVQVMSGLISYYKMIEREYIEHIITQYETKYNVSLYDLIKKDLQPV